MEGGHVMKKGMERSVHETKAESYCRDGNLLRLAPADANFLSARHHIVGNDNQELRRIGPNIISSS